MTDSEQTTGRHDPSPFTLIDYYDADRKCSKHHDIPAHDVLQPAARALVHGAAPTRSLSEHSPRG